MKNRKLSEQQLQFFLDGHQRHEGLQSLVKNLEHEVEIRNFGIVGHIDLMDKCPIEIKTTRAWNNGQKPLHYLRQCAYYCILTKTESCSLITQYINEGIFTFEKIHFTQEELDAYLKEMLEARDKLQFAFDRKNHNFLPFPEGWQCRHCEFKEDCGVAQE
jgi:CRISPR/Cas system-associated exonuclease Cas4 (RecB family)